MSYRSLIGIVVVVTGVAGVTGHYSFDLDISGNAAGRNDISDMDWFGVGFDMNSTAVAGGTLDNVAVVAAIPEPSTLALFSLFGLALLISRRVRACPNP